MKTTRAGHDQTESKHSAKRGLSLHMILTLAAFMPAVAYGIGLRTPNQDPEAVARGNAFVATADNPAAIYYNPAGITQLEGHNVHAGLYLISADTKYESLTGRKAE